MDRNTQEKIQTKCYSCGDPIFVKRDTVAEVGKEVFCEDCLIEAECRNCGRAIQTTHEKYSKFDGNPICKNCTNGPVDLSNPNPDVSEKGVLGRRVVAAVIDLAYPFAIATAFVFVSNFFGISDLAGITVDTLSLLVLVGMALSNYIEKEYSTGQTFGKRLLGIMTVQKDGAEAGLSSVIIRNLFRPIDLVLGYGVGFMFILLTSENQRMGDYFAQTVVVRVND